MATKSVTVHYGVSNGGLLEFGIREVQPRDSLDAKGNVIEHDSETQVTLNPLNGRLIASTAKGGMRPRAETTVVTVPAADLARFASEVEAAIAALPEDQRPADDEAAFAFTNAYLTAHGIGIRRAGRAANERPAQTDVAKRVLALAGIKSATAPTAPASK